MGLFRRILAAVRGSLKANLIAGILFTVPLVATWAALHLLLKWVDTVLLLIPRAYRPENFLPFPIPGLGLIVLVIVLLLVGFGVRNFLGRRLVILWDRLMGHIPFVSKLYSALKQLVDTIFSRSQKDFKRVVLVEYPRPGVYALAFVTGEGVGEVQSKTAKHVINAFVPTTPNPTSGYYIMVPEDEVIPLDMSVEDAFKLLISAGIVNPPAQGNSKKRPKESTP